MHCNLSEPARKRPLYLIRQKVAAYRQGMCATAKSSANHNTLVPGAKLQNKQQIN